MNAVTEAQTGGSTDAEKQSGTKLFVFAKVDDDKKLLEFNSKGELDEWLKAQTGVDVLQIIRGVDKPIRKETRIFIY